MTRLGISFFGMCLISLTSTAFTTGLAEAIGVPPMAVNGVSFTFDEFRRPAGEVADGAAQWLFDRGQLGGERPEVRQAEDRSLLQEIAQLSRDLGRRLPGKRPRHELLGTLH